MMRGTTVQVGGGEVQVEWDDRGVDAALFNFRRYTDEGDDITASLTLKRRQARRIAWALLAAAEDVT